MHSLRVACSADAAHLGLLYGRSLMAGLLRWLMLVSDGFLQRELQRELQNAQNMPGITHATENPRMPNTL